MCSLEYIQQRAKMRVDTQHAYQQQSPHQYGQPEYDYPPSPTPAYAPPSPTPAYAPPSPLFGVTTLPNEHQHPSIQRYLSEPETASPISSPYLVRIVFYAYL
jgi:hypothetical protein